MIDERGGYAVVGSGRLTTLAAREEAVARALLARLFGEVPGLELGWITARQQWAIETAAEAGASLTVRGALMSRGVREHPFPYLPNGLFG